MKKQKQPTPEEIEKIEKVIQWVTKKIIKNKESLNKDLLNSLKGAI